MKALDKYNAKGYYSNNEGYNMNNQPQQMNAGKPATPEEAMWEIFPRSRVYIPTRDTTIIAQATRLNQAIDHYGFMTVSDSVCKKFLKFCDYLTKGLDNINDVNGGKALVGIINEFKTSINIWIESHTPRTVTEVLPDENGCYY